MGRTFPEGERVERREGGGAMGGWVAPAPGLLRSLMEASLQPPRRAGSALSASALHFPFLPHDARWRGAGQPGNSGCAEEAFSLVSPHLHTGRVQRSGITKVPSEEALYPLLPWSIRVLTPTSSFLQPDLLHLLWDVM